MQPLVSVLLPVYNGARFLRQALESVLAQTYTKFELIIIDDGSCDESANIVRQCIDSRIRFYEQPNQGLAATLNRAIGLSQGIYIARQDQDDVSKPKRLEKQIAFLDGHPRCGMVGTWAEIWIEGQPTERVHAHPSDNIDLQFDLLFDNPFVHSSIMLRKGVVEKVGLYTTDPARQPPEDYELWSRVARKFEVANIPELLHVYREVPVSMSRDDRSPFLDRVIQISTENLRWVTRYEGSDENISNLAALLHAAYHRVTLQPDLREMSRLLFAAADRISELYGADCECLRRRAAARVNDLRHHYVNCRNAGWISKAWIRLMNVGKKMISNAVALLVLVCQ